MNGRRRCEGEEDGVRESRSEQCDGGEDDGG